MLTTILTAVDRLALAWDVLRYGDSSVWLRLALEVERMRRQTAERERDLARRGWFLEVLCEFGSPRLSEYDEEEELHAIHAHMRATGLYRVLERAPRWHGEGLE